MGRVVGDNRVVMPHRPNRFADRTEAGHLLAAELWQHHPNLEEVLVLGLPRGGVPVAAPVAERFGAPLDVLVVRKIGFPGHGELAMGAVASGGVVIRNQTVLDEATVSESVFQREADKARSALQALEIEFRGGQESTTVEGHNVILVDDGLATGSTMKAAIGALRQRSPESVSVAVPVAPTDTLAEVSLLADEVTVLQVPKRFMAVGIWYRDFSQVSTEEVRLLLEKHRRDSAN